MKKNKGFTLIELVAVLVILAILALIVTPLVLNIIRKARTSADKRSIDAYGRSIELAVADYLLDKGTFPTSIEQLTIEYSGDEVVCNTTTLKSDSSVYLASCTVGGRSVDEYTYGKEEAAPTYTAYKVGDEVTYNNVNYYVIADSDASETSVTLLKAEPLTYQEVQTYSAGTGAQTSDNSGIGGMQFGTTNTYETSYIKTTLDSWKIAKAPQASEVRLITVDDLKDHMGYVLDTEATSEEYKKTENTPNWLYNGNYWYWTMSQYQDSHSEVWSVRGDSNIGNYGVINLGAVVRPVIVLSKSEL